MWAAILLVYALALGAIGGFMGAVVPRLVAEGRGFAREAPRLKERIRHDTGLTASAGVAPNKFLAKIASGWRKPDGLTIISPERVEPFLQQLPVDALWGVGPVTARKLRERGIERLVDVRAAEPAALREAVGSLTEWLQQLAKLPDRKFLQHRRVFVLERNLHHLR